MTSSNHQSNTAPCSSELNIWVFHDARPGHLSQLEGLVNRLSCHQKCEVNWFNVTQNKLNLQHILYIPEFLKHQTAPDLILGAGHRTHLSVLIAGLKFKAFTTLIMKPSLPSVLFNTVICPKHDGLEDSQKVLCTLGALNKITPASAMAEQPNRNKHIMLIGGPSKHFIFDETQLISSIQQICESNTLKVWHLSDSPRTPTSFIPNLQKLALTNLKLYSYSDDNFGALNTVLKQSAVTWVTPDSMSMVFESLTAGAKTAVFDMTLSRKGKPSRIAKQIRELINEGQVASFKSWQQEKGKMDSMERLTHSPPLWEAERAALWLLKRLKDLAKSETN